MRWIVAGLSLGVVVFLLVIGQGLRAIHADFGMATFLVACAGSVIGLLCLAALVDRRTNPPPPPYSGRDAEPRRR